MIGLVIVSHSRRLAEGVAELAGQMAPDVAIVPSGGDGGGGLGTDFLAVSEAITQADSGAGVLVLYDLGSAKMVADMAAEETPVTVRVVDAPLVEGGVAAAVAAQGNASLDTAAAAAVGAATEAGWTATPPPVEAPPPVETPPTSSPQPPTGEIRARVALTNEVGLHARPAALVARSLAGLDARVVIRFGDAEADATSVLSLMNLGAPGGSQVEVVASGADAAEAVRRVEDLAARDFDE